MNQDFGKLLLRHADDPLLWRESAIELKMAADALLPHYVDAAREEPSIPGSHQRKFAFFHGHKILIGLAIETAIKGLLVTKTPLTLKPKKKKGQAEAITPVLEKGGHGILKGAVDCRVPLSADETNALTRLEEFLIWAAKYPVPLSADVLEKAEIKQLRTHRPTDPDVLNEIFERLLKLYPTQ